MKTKEDNTMSNSYFSSPEYLNSPESVGLRVVKVLPVKIVKEDDKDGKKDIGEKKAVYDLSKDYDTLNTQLNEYTL